VAIQLPYTGVTTNETVPTPYTSGGTPINLNAKEDKANKGVANGYAPLDANAIVPTANLPERVKANWNSNSGDAQILNRPNVNTSTFDGTGGFVDLHGGTDTEWSIAGNAGSIDLSGGDGSTTEATANQDGGNGGSLLLSGESLTGADGGTIDCRGLNGFPGGYINTSSGGGSIDTRGAGAIQLGVTGRRTFLNGSASGSNKTITLPNATGTISLNGHTHSASDITSGTLAASLLGSGTAGAETFLQGNSQWKRIFSCMEFCHSATNPSPGFYYFSNFSDLSAVTSASQRTFSVPIDFSVWGMSISVNIAGTLGVGSGLNTSIGIYDTTTSSGSAISFVNFYTASQSTFISSPEGRASGWYTLVAGRAYSIYWYFPTGHTTLPTQVRHHVRLWGQS